MLGASQLGGQPGPAFRRRLDHALRLYRQGGVSRIIVSGGVGAGDLFSEGEIGVRYLRGQGVPVGVLRAEEQSRTTFQNLRNSRPLMPGAVTLVTDNVHARRAVCAGPRRGTGRRRQQRSVSGPRRATCCASRWRCWPGGCWAIPAAAAGPPIGAPDLGV